MRVNRKSCAARPREGGRHAVSKLRRAVTMEIIIEDRKKSNIKVVIERLKTVNYRRGIDEEKLLTPL